MQRQSNGQIITLNTELGGGGEGKIYALDRDSTLVAKVYHKPTSAAECKLKAMLLHPPYDPDAAANRVSIAWPVDLLIRGGKTVGFLMPRVDGMRAVHDFYNPKTRRDRCPFFNYLYLHRTAQNLAVAISRLHGCGYVVGDVNESNILVSKRALVTLVDTDSFQVRDRRSNAVYHCPVGKPEFTPPELQGKTFRNLKRTPEQDRFGLAVLIFQLLMEGTHPFAGVYTGRGDPPAIEVRIAAGHFPWGDCPADTLRERRVPYRPTPVAPAFEVLHPKLRRLFLQCFENGHRYPAARPDALAWVEALDVAQRELVTCSVNPQHRYGKHLSCCPWCDRTRQLGGRDPFPTQENLARSRRLPPPAPRRKVVRPEPVRSAVIPSITPIRPAVAFIPQFHSVPGTNVGGLWQQVVQCKNDLFAGCVVLLATAIGVVYWSAQSPQTTADGAAYLPGENGAAQNAVANISSDGISASGADDSPLVSIERLKVHGDRVEAVALATGGQIWASSSGDGTVKIGSVSQGKVTQSIEGDRLGAVAFGTDDRTLIGGTVGAVDVWQLPDGTLEDIKPVGLDEIQVAMVRSSGEIWVGGSLNGKLALWNASTQQVAQLSPNTGDRVAAWSRDGKTLATVGQGIQVWDLSTGKLHRTLEADVSDTIEAVALSPDGTIAASSRVDGNTIQFWAVETGNLLHEEPARNIGAIAWSPDGKSLIAGEKDGSIEIWQVRFD
ncbi:PD40 domain-containing protein [Oscillatoriales cyanobacterium LEGE 11467]|uniref:PD40 domain-containing protein n=1 Tax=Zarconia navalis LEGE 11467 TaxID=1828826 RepID=A0A928VWM2_9CYAN|nr:PD40 domain-containing protein [Zarconia navalis LEGE 11467]